MQGSGGLGINAMGRIAGTYFDGNAVLHGFVLAGPSLINTTTGITASASSIASGASVVFTATITAAAGSEGSPTGTVTFLDGATALGSGTVSSGAATFSTTALANGIHSITAVYSGDPAFGTSTSSAVSLTVNASTPDFTISASPATAIVAIGSSTTTSIIVTPVGGFRQQVLLTVLGVPVNTRAMFNSPVLITLDGVNPITVGFTLLANGPTSALSRSLHNVKLAAIAPVGLLCSTVVFAFGLLRRRPGLIIAFAGGIVVFAVTSCGGSPTQPSRTPGSTPVAGLYTLTINGTTPGGNPAHSATYTVTIQ